MIDITSLLSDYNIPFTDSNHEHARPGWVQIDCPFCPGNPGRHLGYNIAKGYWNCWRCGWHPAHEVFLHLTGQPLSSLVKKYSSASPDASSISTSLRDDKKITRPAKITWPVGTHPILLQCHRRYLEKRNFNPNQIQNMYGIRGTGNLGSYKLRIITPIYLKNIMISYLGRDITGRQKAKYKTCKKELEIVPHKEILYAADDVIGNTAIIVEGTMDAWRLGHGTVATFGIDYTQKQISFIRDRFAQVFIGFDIEPQARTQAEKMAIQLSSLGLDVGIIDWAEFNVSDPAELSTEQVKEIRNELLPI